MLWQWERYLVRFRKRTESSAGLREPDDRGDTLGVLHSQHGSLIRWFGARQPRLG